MRKVLVIAWREFFETVKTRAFLLSAVLMPAIIIVLMFTSGRLATFAQSERVGPRVVVVRSEDPAVLEGLRARFVQWAEANPNREFVLEPASWDEPDPALEDRLRSGAVYAHLAVPADAISADGVVRLARRDQQLEAGEALTRMLQGAVEDVRLQRTEPPLARETLTQVTRPVALERLDARTGEAQAADGFSAVLGPFVAMFVVYIGIMGISWGLLTSLLEEKSSRIVEVLLSAVSPTQLMSGKILGMVGVGVLMLGIWGAVALLGALVRGQGVPLTGLKLAYIAAYFVPGFLFMAATLAAVGAACNTLKEAQSLTSPLSLLNIVPILLWLPISQYPDSTLSVGLSFLVPVTPFVMVLRLYANPDLPLWQIIATQAVLWIGVVLMVWAAGRVFRVGILMYGKQPTLAEIVRWARAA